MTQQSNSLKQVVNSPVIQKQFQSLMKENSSQFASSLITLASNDPQLKDAEPMSIISGAMQAAQLNLPLEKQFGFVYLIPFNTKDKTTNKWVKKAQFILGYRGLIQLAQRSGQYRSINVGNIYKGELGSWNALSEELEYNPENKESDDVIGYFGYFKLLNGFEKTVYWTKEQVEKHRIENNKAKNKTSLSGVWASNYDAMAQKTVLRSLISKWGILSVELQQAIVADADTPNYEDEVRKDVTDNANKELLDFDNIDTPDNRFNVDKETGEVLNNKDSNLENFMAEQGVTQQTDDEPGF